MGDERALSAAMICGLGMANRAYSASRSVPNADFQFSAKIVTRSR